MINVLQAIEPNEYTGRVVGPIVTIPSNGYMVPHIVADRCTQVFLQFQDGDKFVNLAASVGGEYASMGAFVFGPHPQAVRVVFDAEEPCRVGVDLVVETDENL